MFNPENVKSCIAELFASARDIKEVCDTYIAIMIEAKEQYLPEINERIMDLICERKEDFLVSDDIAKQMKEGAE